MNNIPEGLRFVIGGAICLLIVLVYFVPSVVAKGKRNWRAIFVLNLVAGWTFAGWVVALVWAYMRDDPKSGSGDSHERGANTPV